MKRILFALVIFAFVLASCAPKSVAPTMAYEKEMARQEAAGAPAPAMDSAMPSEGYAGEAVTNQVVLPEMKRMIIQNADLTIVVKDPVTAMAQVTGMASEMGGFVVTSYVYKTQSDTGMEVPEATITIRVPAEKLTTALDQIRKLTDDPSKDVLAENISGQDVTKEYTDLNSRLKNLQDAETQLRTFMTDASKTEDVLAVYRELTNVTEQIEVIKGQMQYYEEASAMSAISLRIVAQETVKPIVVAGWEPQGEAREAVRKLIQFWQGFVEVMIWFVVFLLPVLLTIALPFFLVFLFIRWLVLRGKARRKAKTVMPTVEEKK